MPSEWNPSNLLSYLSAYNSFLKKKKQVSPRSLACRPTPCNWVLSKFEHLYNVMSIYIRRPMCELLTLTMTVAIFSVEIWNCLLWRFFGYIQQITEIVIAQILHSDLSFENCPASLTTASGQLKYVTLPTYEYFVLNSMLNINVDFVIGTWADSYRSANILKESILYLYNSNYYYYKSKKSKAFPVIGRGVL
jgi:hypothetical protein